MHGHMNVKLQEKLLFFEYLCVCVCVCVCLCMRAPQLNSGHGHMTIDPFVILCALKWGISKRHI